MKAQAGDVYCTYYYEYQIYTACQITKVYPSPKDGKEMAIRLILNWIGDRPMNEADLPDIKPLYEEYMYWDGKPGLSIVDPEVPAGYVYVGNCPPLLADETRATAYEGWGDRGRLVFYQHQWEQIPKEARRAFKSAVDSEELTELAGQEIRVNTKWISDAEYPIKSVRELRVLPCLSNLDCSMWYPDLLAYLRENPFIHKLTLRAHGQRTLDLRGSHLRELVIDLNGVEEIWMNDELEALYFLNGAPEQCKFHAGKGIASLRLNFKKTVRVYPELRDVGMLHCEEVGEIDFAELNRSYPRLRELRLWGNPAFVRNFSTLADFRELVFFSTSDLFGFTAADIPKPEQMEHLDRFWMDSLPEDAAKEIRRLYKKRRAAGLDLWITKARKPEWLAENLDNPFRHWQGEEYIPASAAKRAANLYKKTRSELIRLAKEQPEDRMEKALEAVSEYAKTFNRMSCVETMEREDIYEALTGILDALPGEILDKSALIDRFEELRDF